MRHAFIHPTTGVLLCHGFVETNGSEDVRLDVPDIFDLTPGIWRWDGTAWVAYIPPAPSTVLTTDEVLRLLVKKGVLIQKDVDDEKVKKVLGA